MVAIIETLREVRQEIFTKYKAEVKGIFGSFARGEQRSESDLDVLVAFGEGATLLDYVGLGLFLEDKLGIPVDVVPIDTIKAELREGILHETVSV